MKIRVYLKVRRKELLVQNSDILKSEMLVLYVFATFRGHRAYRRIEDFLDDKSKACGYITNEKLPRKSKNQSI